MTLQSLVEQNVKGGVSIQIEPSERVLARLDNMALTSGAAYGFLAGILVAILFLVTRRGT